MKKRRKQIRLEGDVRDTEVLAQLNARASK